jgi:hypothetical protein
MDVGLLVFGAPAIAAAAHVRTADPRGPRPAGA